MATLETYGGSPQNLSGTQQAMRDQAAYSRYLANSTYSGSISIGTGIANTISTTGGMVFDGNSAPKRACAWLWNELKDWLDVDLNIENAV